MPFNLTQCIGSASQAFISCTQSLDCFSPMYGMYKLPNNITTLCSYGINCPSTFCCSAEIGCVCIPASVASFTPLVGMSASTGICALPSLYSDLAASMNANNVVSSSLDNTYIWKILGVCFLATTPVFLVSIFTLFKAGRFISTLNEPSIEGEN